MNVADYLTYETERQSGTVREAVGMSCAYGELAGIYAGRRQLNEDLIKYLSFLITGNKDYRRVPAVFNQGTPAIHYDLIPQLMHNLEGMMKTCSSEEDSKINWIVHEFLVIHPFADGNGRVASLLWNFLRGSFFDPEPLPNFFGEN